MTPITTPQELIDAAQNPNLLPAGVSAELLSGAAELLDAEYSGAAKAAGQDLVRRIRLVRATADRLATVSTDGTSRAARVQSQLARLAAGLGDEHILWLLASGVMTADQHAAVRSAFA